VGASSSCEEIRLGSSGLASMTFPLSVTRASWNLLFSSSSSSSSDQRESGFFAPPESTFLVTSRQSVSISLFLADPPGEESQYCLTTTAEKPATPPKYWKTRSSSSAECGMFDPPWTTDPSRRSTPASSILFRFDSRLTRSLSFFVRRCCERHTRQMLLYFFSFEIHLKCCGSRG
jgi:hypothetical protein